MADSAAAAALSTEVPAGTPPTGEIPAGTPPAANGEWYSSVANEDIRNWAINKNFKDPAAALESSYNLEKLIGFEKAGRTVVLPKDDATPEEMRAFYTKMGAPEKVEDYKIPVPEGQSDEFAKTAASWFHELGIPAKTAEKLSAKWNEYVGQFGTQDVEQFAANSVKELDGVFTEWGAAKENNLEFSKRAMREFLPVTDEKERGPMLEKLERAMGTANMMKMFAKIGQGLGEAKNIDSDDVPNFNPMTPAQAKARLESLKQDKAWTTAYLNGDKNKAAEMNRLQAYAAGVNPD